MVVQQEVRRLRKTRFGNPPVVLQEVLLDSLHNSVLLVIPIRDGNSESALCIKNLHVKLS